MDVSSRWESKLGENVGLHAEDESSEQDHGDR